MNSIRSVCVYCGSSGGADPRFAAAARTLGKAFAEQDIRLVYGGGGGGLMGEMARATLAAGGKVTGIIPRFLKDRENMLSDVQDLVVVPDMHTRKQRMFDEADAFVALPGGIGTLEELVEQLTWVQLQRHQKPVLIADIGGFWAPLLALFEHMRDMGFIGKDFGRHYIVTGAIDEVVGLLQAAAERNPRREFEPQTLDPRL